jgi:hypothetical protein
MLWVLRNLYKNIDTDLKIYFDGNQRHLTKKTKKKSGELTVNEA